jgi:outer membrane immunogenic protein
MKKLFYILAFAIAALLPASSIHAADLDVPPPEMRPAYFDWSGPYIGIFGAAVAVDGTWDATCSSGGIACGGGATSTYEDFEHSGIGYAYGIVGGINYQFEDIVIGVEGDWAFGGTVATNDEPGIDTELSFDNIATLRARLGWAHDNTLIYLTGGLAAVDMGFDAVMSSDESDRAWVYGWTAGGGIEHAFTPNFHGRIEYLYVGLPDTDFSMTDDADTDFDVTQSFNDIHMVRAGLTYNFTW